MALAFVFACNNDATDGDPATDTTVMPPDPYVGADTVSHINRRDGAVPADTSLRDTLDRN